MARIGPHVDRNHAKGARPGLAKHIEAAVREAADGSDFRVGAAAVFVSLPRGKRVEGKSARAINLTPAEEAPLRALAARLPVIGHSCYNAPPWGGDPTAAAFVREEARTCRRAGLAGLVVHLPKKPPATVLKFAPRLCDPEGVRIYLETPAVVPPCHYETPEKLAGLFRALAPLGDFGLCIDTAHLWTNGVDLSSRAAAEAWLGRLEAADIPPDRVMFHLNDSELLRGHGPDSHAALGHGQMWGAYRGRLAHSGLAAFAEYAARHGCIVILERGKEELAGDYRALRELVPASVDLAAPAADAPAAPAEAAEAKEDRAPADVRRGGPGSPDDVWALLDCAGPEDAGGLYTPPCPAAASAPAPAAATSHAAAPGRS